MMCYCACVLAAACDAMQKVNFRREHIKSFITEKHTTFDRHLMISSALNLLLLVDVVCAFTVSCSIGSFYNVDSNHCELCPEGMYQDEEGQLSCKVCPSGQDNHGILGARDMTECSGIYQHLFDSFY